LQLSPPEIAEALAELFRKRANSARHLPIAPLDDYTKASVLRIVDQPGALDTSRALLDNIFVINVNGDVFTRPFAYDVRYCLGNIARQSMQQMLEGEVYRACQQNIRRKKLANCTACDFRRYCDSSPMHEHGSVVPDGGELRCGVPRRTMAAIHAELTQAGVDRATVGEWAREWLAQPHAAVA
jgi:radical SAM protein with 4Fe4S-binding SPASM domain